MNAFEAYGLIRRAECFGWQRPLDGSMLLLEAVELAQEYLYEKGIERRPASSHNTGSKHE